MLAIIALLGNFGLENCVGLKGYGHPFTFALWFCMLMMIKRILVCSGLGFGLLGVCLASAQANNIYDDSKWEASFLAASAVKDCAKVMTILNDAQAVGNIMAHNVLGLISWQGGCVDKDIVQAETFFRYGAERGNSHSAIFLAQMFYAEKGLDDPRAKAWAERAQFVMIRGGYNLWHKKIYLINLTSPLSPHLQNTLKWLKKIATENASVSFEIGKDFLEQMPWPESKVLACYWLEHAAYKGHAQASYLVARQLFFGEGVVVAPARAAIHLTRAFKQNHVKSFVLAAQVFEQGQGMEQSNARAYNFWMRAKNLGADVTDDINRVEALLDDQQIKSILYWIRDETARPSLSAYTTHIEPLSCRYASR